MTELLTSARMRNIERSACENGGASCLELMERAGQGVVETIFRHWPEVCETPQSACVLCGPGNNGGDGFVVARLLAERGWELQVFLSGEAENLQADARINYAKWCRQGDVSPLTEKAVRQAGPVAMYVDALFGTGLSRPLSGELSAVTHYLNRLAVDGNRPPVVAVDAPSGLCLDSGRVLGGEAGSLNSSVLFADLTVTFDSPKIGHFLADGPACCTELRIVDIGLQKWRESRSTEKRGGQDGRPDTGGQQTCLITRDPLVPDRRPPFVELAKVAQKKSAHKFKHGHAVVLSGAATKTGAARLAARGALRVGAGLVTIGCPTDALAEHAAQLNEIMLTGIEHSNALCEMLKDKRITSVCLGPGIGVNDTTRKMVEVALTSRRKTVLDADALTVFQDRPEDLFDLLHDDVVLTPHAGEFSRLFPDISAKLNENVTLGPAYSKIDATRQAAGRAGAVVLYKGPDTVIAAPNGPVAVHGAFYDRAAPWLATAGAGDVLAGLIAGLMARGWDAHSAAASAAWLHVESARRFGAGLIAGDIVDGIPAVLAELQG